MNRLQRTRTTLALAAFALLPSTADATTSSPWLAFPLAECEDVAEIERFAAMENAYADAIRAYAHCVNEGQGNDPLCIQEILDELQEALDEIDERHRARLALCALLGSGPWDPQLDPQEFTVRVDHLYFPLVPGRTLIYEKQTLEGDEERTAVTTLRRTFEVDGITCRVVRDVVTIDGELVEDTDDWFAQDVHGNVWYLGEISKNYEGGELTDLDGSWKHGEDHAKGGIQMRATPMVGDVYRQEFLLGEAEDVARVVALGETVTVHAGTFRNCLKTEEWTPLEPDAREHKYYAPGVGLVLEVDLETGERNELVGIRRH